MNPRKTKIMLVLGTRPEAVKLASIVWELSSRKSLVDLVVVNTGQHRELLQQMLNIFEIETQYDLALMSSGQGLASLYARALEGVSELLAKEKPDWVVVQGDTSTAAAAAQAAFYARIPVAHVEAGLRTYDMDAPWPEEYNRRAIALTAKLHFAPTEPARRNLLDEGVDPSGIFLTGNTGIDSLLWMSKRVSGEGGKKFSRKWKFEPALPLVLCTFHRREAFGDSMRGIFSAVAELAGKREAQIVLPMHPNPEVQRAARAAFGESPPSGVHLCAPLDYEEFVWLMNEARLIVTDSGGVQEEAPTIGKPVVVMRDKTERPESVTAGSSILAGTSGENLLTAVRGILGDKNRLERMSVPRPVYGDGRAAKRIAAAMLGGNVPPLTGKSVSLSGYALLN